MPSKKITLLTTGQPSTNPRLVKEADALSAAGYDVTVLYCFWAHWAEETDKALLASRSWKAIQVGGNPHTKKLRWYFTRLRRKLAKSPERKLFRAYDELLAKALKTPTDLYIAHNLGALPVAARAAEKTGKPFGFDAEDFHRGEEDPNQPHGKLKAQLEDQYIPKAAYTTAASPLIAQAYRKLFSSLPWLSILNVFPRKQQPEFQARKEGALRLIWFSQTLGKSRGIQDIIRAMNKLPEIPLELSLVGKSTSELEVYFLALKEHDQHRLSFIQPMQEEALNSLVAQHDIGLALEPGFSPNNNIALSNKIFTYLLAGNAIIASDTDAQRQFLEQYPGIGQVYPIGDAEALAGIIWNYHEHRKGLEAARRRAWELAREELNWEQEQGKFLGLVREVLE